MGRYLDVLRQVGSKDTARFLDVLEKSKNLDMTHLKNQKNPATVGCLGLLGAIPAAFPPKKITLLTIPAICRMLHIDWPEVDRQELLDDEDLYLYAKGRLTLQQIIVYLVSWNSCGCETPFLLQSDAVVGDYIAGLPLANRRDIAAWLPENNRKILGGGS